MIKINSIIFNQLKINLLDLYKSESRKPKVPAFLEDIKCAYVTLVNTSDVN